MPVNCIHECFTFCFYSHMEYIRYFHSVYGYATWIFLIFIAILTALKAMVI